MRVGIMGTGGLTHHVIDEQMDRALLDALKDKNREQLLSFPESRYVDGTSEVKNWIVVAGAIAAHIIVGFALIVDLAVGL